MNEKNIFSKKNVFVIISFLGWAFFHRNDVLKYLFCLLDKIKDNFKRCKSFTLSVSFIRKMESEDSITLPYTYFGLGTFCYFQLFLLLVCYSDAKAWAISN